MKKSEIIWRLPLEHTCFDTNYDRFPKTVISSNSNDAALGYSEICNRFLNRLPQRKKAVLVIECYPGIDQIELLKGLEPLEFAQIIHSDELAFEPEKIDEMIEQDLTDDPVFGIMTVRKLKDFFYAEKLEAARRLIDSLNKGVVLVYGVGASLVCVGDFCVLADITRWEIQLRYRRGMNNWRTSKVNQSNRAKYKRGFFAEWRWADKIKEDLLPVIDAYLDMSIENSPVLIDGDIYRAAIETVARRPFRLVPYFDPGVWGGDWMKSHFGLPENGGNYAWCFDGVPEENSLAFDFGGRIVQTPAMNLVLLRPDELLGKRVRVRFGKEFPIRFDLLDTVHGQNLSLQVHPLTEYIQKHFNMRYTQDESYYILDACGEEACVYLGVKSGIDPSEMEKALRGAEQGEAPFDDTRFVNRIPVKKHDHVLIPAGTIHCSGANTMVLEISATPYIFTFKLWDWGRVDLDGKPRPIHLNHGLANIQWNRDSEWVKAQLVNAVSDFSDGDGVIERTGLHEFEFIDTFRVATDGEKLIKSNGSVFVLNLVDGSRAFIESCDRSFTPFEVHYAETCIVPAAVGDFKVASGDGKEIKLILACVRK